MVLGLLEHLGEGVVGCVGMLKIVDGSGYGEYATAVDPALGAAVNIAACGAGAFVAIRGGEIDGP